MMFHRTLVVCLLAAAVTATGCTSKRKYREMYLNEYANAVCGGMAMSLVFIREGMVLGLFPDGKAGAGVKYSRLTEVFPINKEAYLGMIKLRNELYGVDSVNNPQELDVLAKKIMPAKPGLAKEMFTKAAAVLREQAPQFWLECYLMTQNTVEKCYVYDKPPEQLSSEDKKQLEKCTEEYRKQAAELMMKYNTFEKEFQKAMSGS